jgi:hypothetical protein
LYLKDNITLGEGRGNTFTMLLKERRKGDCGNAINSEYFDNSGGSYTGRPSESESLWKKMIGKSYSGKSPDGCTCTISTTSLLNNRGHSFILARKQVIRPVNV